MLPFCGQDKCLVDANGRIKLSPRVVNDFIAECEGEVALYCLPEKAIAIYPESTFLEMRRQENEQLSLTASSLLLRRSQRRFGAMSRSEKISRQGRISLAGAFREYAELFPATEAMVIGVEIGVEIWNAQRWNEELELVNSHFMEKGSREMSADLI